jgi:5'-nucleotidase
VFKKVYKVLSASAIASLLFAGSISAAPLQPISHLDWMQKKAFVVGNEKGDLALNRTITYAEVVTLLARLQGVKELGPTETNPHWAAGALEWAVEQGAITKSEAESSSKAVTAAKAKEIAAKVGYNLSVNGTEGLTRQEFIHALGEAVTTHITIGHTNDVHGHIVEDPSQKEFGYAKMATLINEWRKENPNFLLLDAGDTFQGTIYVNQFKGESILPILNHLAYETMAAGNHEFDFGWEQVLKLAEQLDYPMISSNVFKEDGTELLPPVHYAEIGGKKFAFLGFVTEETPVVTHPDNVKGLTFKDPVEIAKKWVPELKKEVDHVIVVSHVGIDVDREIAKNVPGIDLIVGGHSHTPLKVPELVNGTYIVQDWEYGKSLGRADLYYFNDELVQFSGGLVEYDENVKADPEVDALVKKISTEIDKALDIVVAKAEVTLDGDRADVRSRETNLGNLVADIMLERTKLMPGYEADVALTNGGGIRAKINAGDITKKALLTTFPFPNTLAVVEVTGKDLWAALENGVSQVETGGGRFPQISGMSFKYDSTKPVGERVLEVKIGGQHIDLEKTYRVATNDFLAAGGDGYEVFTKSKMLNTGITFYDMMEQALTNMKSVNPKTEDRIVKVK